MQPNEWPFVVHVTCCRHKGPAQIEVSERLSDHHFLTRDAHGGFMGQSRLLSRFFDFPEFEV